MELSVMRSAVSEDSPRGDGAGGREDELALQVERLRRRNHLLQRGRQVMEEQLQLFREEIQSRNRKIQQLSLRLAEPPPAPSASRHPRPRTPSPDPAPLILLEKQEQLGVAGEALRVQAFRLQELEHENRQLREELAHGGAVVKQLKDSSRAQISYLRTQVDALEQEMQEKEREQTAMRLFFENLAQKENSKWQKTTDNLKEQLRVAEENTASIALRHQNDAEEGLQLKQKNQELEEEVVRLSSTIAFLQSLLEEAKGAFIDTQLQQQDQLEREEREKKQYRRRNQLLRTQLKSLKGNSHTASTCEPSNKSTRTASTVSVTPFRTSSGRPKPSEL